MKLRLYNSLWILSVYVILYMKSLSIILFIIGAFFVVYSFRSPIAVPVAATTVEEGTNSTSGVQNNVAEAETYTDLPKAANNSTTRVILDEQFSPSFSTQSFYKNLFDQKSAFLTYPFNNDLIFRDASMAQEMTRLKREDAVGRISTIPVQDLVSLLQQQEASPSPVPTVENVNNEADN